MLYIKSGEKAKREKEKIWKKYLDKKSNKDYTTLYVHVPFCIQKCKYCEYLSKVVHGRIPDSYLDYLEEQFKEANSILENEPIKAINFGGGTPNILSPKQLDRLFNMISKYWKLETSDENERGFEFNPYLLSDEHIEVLKNSYINRLSMGIQSFNEGVISAEHRLYSSKERVSYIYDSVKSFAKIVNVDLIAGLTNQTEEILIEDVRSLLNIGVESLTIYELNHMPWHLNRPLGKKHIEEMLRAMYRELGNYPSYRYVGTTEDVFMHCNRFYKNVDTFKYFYNPAPQGYNNILAFNLNDENMIYYPYSHFTSINTAYQKLTKKTTVFFSFEANLMRPHWKNLFGEDIYKERKMNYSAL